MIRNITAINYLGESLLMELGYPEKSGILVRSIDGIGPPKAILNTTEYASADGSLFNSAKIVSRNILLNLFFRGDDAEQTRMLTYRIFPLKKQLTLVVETDSRIAYVNGYVESNEPYIFSKNSGCTISIVCPDPFFYALENNSTRFFGVTGVFKFPFSNESTENKLLKLGDIANRTESNVYYEGDSDVGVIITINAIGPATNVAITNTRTQELMRIDTTKLQTLTGSAIINMDEITISTIRGKKSITLLRNGEYINILNCLDKDVDWLQIERGDNLFAYSAETGIDNLQFVVDNVIAYDGI